MVYQPFSYTKKCKFWFDVNYNLVYLRVNHVCITNDCCNLRVTVSTLGTFIDVGTADNGQTVVNDADFTVDVHLEYSHD